jgi:amino acid adenylation domain-containing protein
MRIIFEKKEYGCEDYARTVEEFEIDYPHAKRIAVILKRSPQLLFLLHYLFNNKITYIPIDPLYPQERIQYMLKNSNPDSIIIDSKKRSDYILDELNLPQKMFDEGVSYILYTSGSTGNPKGVKVTQESLLNFIDGISEIIDFSEGKRIGCFTTVSFDIFFLESIMALQKGLTVVLANDNEQRNPKLMAELIINNNIDMIQMTPSRMQLLCNHDKELSCLKNVKEIMIGGEPFPLSLLRILQQKTTAKIYNMYGPTETTIWSSVGDLTHKDYIDIGRPIKNTQIYIVDENLFILPDGQAGEICIAGKGLAKSYVGRNDLTTEKFVSLLRQPEIKVYRTGDLGRYLENGNLEYLGRTDNQVKIRGYRIELEEIESHLNQFERIKQSVVIALETNENEKILQAFYTSEGGINTKDISDYLSTKLPSYMIPSIFIRVEEFIQTSNGKIDRKRVLECIEIKSDEILSQNSDFVELNGIQKRAFEVIIENLSEKKLDDILFDMDFISVGLDSITFIKIVVALEGEFDFEFDDEMLLITKFPTIKSMIEYVESKI